MTQFVSDHLICASINNSNGPLLLGNSSDVEIGQQSSTVSVLGNLLVDGPLTVNSQSSQEFTLPQTRGTLNQLLVSDGQGSTTWSSAPPPPGVPESIQDSAGTTQLTCSTPNQIVGSLPLGTVFSASSAESYLTCDNTSVVKCATGGEAGFYDTSVSRVGIDSSSSFMKSPDQNNSASVSNSNIQLVFTSVLRDTLDATTRVFSGTDGTARLTIDDSQDACEQRHRTAVQVPSHSPIRRHTFNSDLCRGRCHHHPERSDKRV